MKTIVIALLAILTAGCASAGTGNQKIMDGMFRESIQVGVTKSDDVLAILGEPSHIESSPDLKRRWIVWRYTGTDRVIPALCYVPLLDLTQKQTLRTRVVDIFFDEKGVVADLQVESQDKEKMFAVGTVSLLLAGLGAVAAAGATPYSPYYARGHYYPGKAVIATTPLAGGGSVSTIKWYR